MILTIFGYPKSGKTLLFNLLTDQHEEVSKFAASSANEYHKAIVEVPDHRLGKLAEFFKTPPVYAKIEFLDTGAAAFGEGKSTTFLDLLRRADGLVHMVRGFDDDEIIHPKEEINPVRDMKDMEDELIANDFISIEKRLERLAVDVMKMKSKELVEQFELFKRLKAHLEEHKPLRVFPFNKHEELMVKGFTFLSQKPLINIINTDDVHYLEHKKLEKEPANNSTTLVFVGKIEQELLELDKEDRAIFQAEYGLDDYCYVHDCFIKACYRLMDLISFFTVSEVETRAWTIKDGDTAYIASGKIHSDIQQGFIRGETIGWQVFLDAGSFNAAKEKGLLRLEGKEYIVKDGEIVHFRFNK